MSMANNSISKLLCRIATAAVSSFVFYKTFSSQTKRDDTQTKKKARAALDQPQCEAVIFDMDGLMIDSEPFWEQAQIECFAKVGIHLTHQDCEDTTGVRILDICRFRFEQKPWNIEKLGITIEQLSDMILDRVIELVEQKGQPLKGLQNCLNYVQSKSINNNSNNNNNSKLKLAVCSSSSPRLINAVCKNRLNYIFNDCFDVYMSAEHLEYGKPHPDVYIQCAKKLGVKPVNCLAFEDSLAGTLSAKSAQMKVISIPQQYPNHTNKFAIADKVLPSLDHFNDDIWNQIWPK